MKVLARRVSFVFAQKNSKCVSMYVSEGEGLTRFENSRIEEFFMEKGRLDSKGAEFELEWEIDQNLSFI